MKREKMLRAMELIDEKYVDEAAPSARRKRRKHPKLMAFAACFVLMLTALSLWLFIPFSTNPPDVSRYSESEYYAIIKQLNLLTYVKPGYKNNFDRILNSFAKGDAMNTGTGAVPGSSSSYREVTDNQADGVIEADLIKRSDEYIYYLYGDTLTVYSIEGEDSKEVGSYSIVFPTGTYYTHSNNWEFYLSADCRTVTVVAQCGSQTSDTCVMLVSLDVSDPTDIKLKKSVTVSGSYLTSRSADGKLLLVSNFYVGFSPDFSDESKFIPQIDSGDGVKSIPVEDIVTPETLTSPRYTVVCKLDEQTLALEDASAFLSYSDTVYVSADRIYLTSGYSDITEETDGFTTSVSMTEISALAYTGEGLEHSGTVAVEGSVKNQYSLDEYEGILRVVTTTNFNRMRTTRNGDSLRTEIDRRNGTSASLYCIDLENWEIVAKVADFAPKGEGAESVRFDGERAYVCTAEVVTFTDPVFFFDLSDINNITYKDTGVIEGYSTSLVDFGEGYLLGIGVGDARSSLKIEIYEEGENNVHSVCKYEQENVSYSTEYKSYLIDRERRLVGLGLTSYQDKGNYSERYILLCFDNYGLTELVNVELRGENHCKRAVVIDDFLYLFGSDGMKVLSLEPDGSE